MRNLRWIAVMLWATVACAATSSITPAATDAAIDATDATDASAPVDVPHGCYRAASQCAAHDPGDAGTCPPPSAFNNLYLMTFACSELCLRCLTGNDVFPTAICNGSTWAQINDVSDCSAGYENWIQGPPPNCPCAPDAGR